MTLLPSLGNQRNTRARAEHPLPDSSGASSELPLERSHLIAQSRIGRVRIAETLGEIQRNADEACDQRDDHGLLPWGAARCSGILPKRAGEILCVSAQAFTRTQDGLGLLIIERSGVWMPCHAQVRPGTTLIVVSDVAFADIAGQHENFSCGKE